MTPKEKAEELVGKMALPENVYQGQVLAKQCAIIAVDEIIKAIDFDWMEVQNLDRQYNYWVEVKEEIEKL